LIKVLLAERVEKDFISINARHELHELTLKESEACRFRFNQHD